ncbi:MAG: TolC family protein [Deltaproteobacteria bacterium]|nr:TolC family protein [Deltaproteobacteria bacterium]
MAKAASQYRQLLERQRERRDALRVELMTGWKEQEDARQGVAASRQNVAASEEAYRSALALYRVGKATGLDVLTAEVELTPGASQSHPLPSGLRDRPGQGEADYRNRNTRN